MPIFSGTDSVRARRRLVIQVTVFGLVLLVVALLAALALGLPDASIFNENVERIFAETDLKTQAEIKLLEVLAASGSLFEKSLTFYREIILTLIFLSFALTLAVAGLLLSNLGLREAHRDLSEQLLTLSHLSLNRQESSIEINNERFKLTPANAETLALLLEARLDNDYLTGQQIEAMISGKPAEECEEAAGAMRVKRLRDALGNQIVSALLLRHISGRGYTLEVSSNIIAIK